MRIFGRFFAFAAASLCLVSSPVLAQDEPGKAAYDIGTKQDAEKRYDEARISFKAACDAGYLAGCRWYGYLLEKGSGGAKDVDGALRIYTEACRRGDQSACAGRGSILLGRTQYKEALQLANTACAADSVRGCVNGGYMYEKGLGVPAEPARALQLYQRACEMESATGCHNFAVVTRDSVGGTGDKAKALALFKRNCDGNAYADSCYAGGLLIPDSDYPTKQAYYLKGCDGGSSSACYLSGHIYYNWMRRASSSSDIARNASSARKQYSKACELGHEKACPLRQVNSASLMARAKSREDAAAWDAKSKATIRKLNAYQPGNHGCSFLKHDVYSDSQASIDRSISFTDDDFRCIRRFLRNETSRLNAILAESGGSAKVVGINDNRDVGTISVSSLEGCKCVTERNAAMRRISQATNALMKRHNRRITERNTIIRNGY